MTTATLEKQLQDVQQKRVKLEAAKDAARVGGELAAARETQRLLEARLADARAAEAEAERQKRIAKARAEYEATVDALTELQEAQVKPLMIELTAKALELRALRRKLHAASSALAQIGGKSDKAPPPRIHAQVGQEPSLVKLQSSVAAL